MEEIEAVIGIVILAVLLVLVIFCSSCTKALTGEEKMYNQCVSDGHMSYECAKLVQSLKE